MADVADPQPKPGESVRIIYAGTDDTAWGNTYRRFRWFGKLGHEARFLPIGFPFQNRHRVIRSLSRRVMGHWLLRRINREVLDACMRFRPRVLWIDKGYTVLPETLQRIKQRMDVSIVSHLNDTPFTLRAGESQMWTHFKEAIPLYDVHLVSQGFQVQQFLQAGARRVLRFMHGLDPGLHRPQPPSLAPAEVEGSLLFIGNCEPDRVGLAEELHRAFGRRLKIFGPNWDRLGSSYLKRSGCLNGPIYLERYAAAIGAAGVCLGFLSVSNQDQITRRSYEIPGCGGCFLGQRTPDHACLLREGEEALFWLDVRALIEKARFLLADREEADRLKANAFRRSQELGFGYDRRIPRWLEFVFGQERMADELMEAAGPRPEIS